MHRSSVGRLIAALFFLASAGPLASTTPDPSLAQKLDAPLQKRASHLTGRTRVIVRARQDASGSSIDASIRAVGGSAGRSLSLINSRVVELPNAALAALARNPMIERVSIDREVVGAMERTSGTIGATAVRQSYGYDGAGIGVAVIDSGVLAAHDDLAGAGGGPRITAFVDFVNGGAAAYDDYGHGTHVSGIVAGNGFDSGGARTGVAPGSDLIVLKVLDANGRGRISDVIAALEYTIANKDALGIRVVNLSVATGVYESYNTDPLTVAARRAVESGLVVVAASGNNGRDAQGRTHHGGVTAPGNAPWVLTVGASSHMGTIDRGDDTIAPFSSRGPSAIDYSAKPDVVAPGVGIESLSDPDGTLYSTYGGYLLPGTVARSFLPYLSLTGSSMSAPVVSGTVALMLQANPSLTPNAVKAILQYTAEYSSQYDPLTQGAGFLNAKGAVGLARYLGSPSSVQYPNFKTWGRRLMWGNRLLQGGRLRADVNAWATDVTWGAPLTPGGQSVEWGVLCSTANCNSIIGPWRAESAQGVNVVWGPACGGLDCQTPWTGEIWGTTDEGDTVVWGTADEGDTVVWGTTDEGDTVVWGTTDGEDTVVWGTSCTDPACEPTIWKTP
jgi:serine protease AprX